MQIDHTKCPFIQKLLREGFTLEQAYILYKNERLSIKTVLIRHKEFDKGMLEYLCSVMKNVRYVQTIDPKKS